MVKRRKTKSKTSNVLGVLGPSKKQIQVWCRAHNVVVSPNPVWIGGALNLVPKGHRPPKGMTDGFVASAFTSDGRLRGQGFGNTRDEARADVMRRTELHGAIPDFKSDYQGV